MEAERVANEEATRPAQQAAAAQAAKISEYQSRKTTLEAQRDEVLLRIQRSSSLGERHKLQDQRNNLDRAIKATSIIIQGIQDNPSYGEKPSEQKQLIRSQRPGVSTKETADIMDPAGRREKERERAALVKQGYTPEQAKAMSIGERRAALYGDRSGVSTSPVVASIKYSSKDSYTGGGETTNDGRAPPQGLAPGVYGGPGGQLIVTRGKKAQNAGEFIKKLQEKDAVFSYAPYRVDDEGQVRFYSRAPLYGPESNKEYLKRVTEQREQLYKQRNDTPSSNGKLESSGPSSNTDVYIGRGNYSGIRRRNSSSGSDDLVGVPGDSLGVSKIQGTLTAAPADKKYLGFIPTSERLNEQNNIATGPIKAGYYVAGIAVGAGERFVDTGRGAINLITSPYQTTKEFLINTYEAFKRPRETLIAVGAEASRNPPKFIGGLGADYLTGRAIGAAPRIARNQLVRVGSDPIPVNLLTTPDVAAGTQKFPLARSAEEAVAAFEGSRDPVSGRLVVSHATANTFGRETVTGLGGRPNSAGIPTETQGLYVAPGRQTSIYFLGTSQQGGYSLLPKFNNPFNRPEIIVSSAQGIERVPGSLIAREGGGSFSLTNEYIGARSGTDRIFLTPRSEKGFAGFSPSGPVTGFTTEIEAVIPANTRLVNVAGADDAFGRALGVSNPSRNADRIAKVKGYRYYTTVDGVNVPIKEYRPVFSKELPVNNAPGLSVREFQIRVQRGSKAISSSTAAERSRSILGDAARSSIGTLRSSSRSSSKLISSSVASSFSSSITSNAVQSSSASKGSSSSSFVSSARSSFGSSTAARGSSLSSGSSRSSRGSSGGSSGSSTPVFIPSYSTSSVAPESRIIKTQIGIFNPLKKEQKRERYITPITNKVKYGYAPSFTALGLGITGTPTVKSGGSGLAVRPIVGKSGLSLTKKRFGSILGTESSDLSRQAGLRRVSRPVVARVDADSLAANRRRGRSVFL